MVHVAQEMERLGFALPLLIGGATTSKVHTAVKIDPQYRGPVVHVLDASRAVGVAGRLLQEASRAGFAGETKAEYGRIRAQRAAQDGGGRLLPLAEARAHKLQLDWRAYRPPRPTFLGTRVLAPFPLAELRDRIDWTPFFQTWELGGVFPAILDDAQVGEQARNLFADAERMLDQILAEGWLEARAVVGFFAANAVDDDDIEVYAGDERGRMLARLCFLRQQMAKSGPRAAPNLCLADFAAPRASGVPDYIGAFAVTAGLGIEKRLAAFAAEHDDYQQILLKALADRLAEALAERLHERVRRELWGYAPDESLTNADLIRERYRGIRPAPGYPACPDHTLKHPLWKLLEPDVHAGIRLTESLAMLPAASVSGFYLAHPEARYFGIGRIGEDQVADYARRNSTTREEAERWLAAVLAYTPARQPIGSVGSTP